MSCQEPAGALEVLDETGQGVRVEFHESGDRFGHLILAVRGEKVFPVLESFEGTESQSLSHAPCFQEIHQQGQTLFLTGASSAGHWSMSVQAAEARILEYEDTELLGTLHQRYGLNAAGAPRDSQPVFRFLLFDVACRLKDSDHHVGSEYLLAETFDSGLVGVSTTALVADTAGDAPILQLLGAKTFENILTLHPEPACFVSHAEGANLRFFSPAKFPKKLPATVQWRYGVGVC